MASSSHLSSWRPPTEEAGAEQRRWRVLVVDDERINRSIFARLMGPRYDVLEAEDGQSAVTLAATGDVDLIIMDLNMPGLDGLEATRRIKHQAGENFVPVVIVTADADPETLSRGIDAGGDDFLVKPVSRVVLDAKLKANLRLREMFLEVQRQRDELSYFREHARKDYAVAQRVFENILSRGTLSLPSLIYKTAPMESFNGDLIMVTPISDSVLRVFVGDFTGHGLSAAVGALPVADTFYATAARHLSLETTLREINVKVRRALPLGMFLSGCMVDVDAQAGRLVCWNGGLPMGYLMDEGRAIKARLASRHVPLGILTNAEFDDTCEVLPFDRGDRLFLYSDGVIETANVSGELFGRHRLEAVLAEKGSSAENLQEALTKFHAGLPQTDDVTYCEIKEQGLAADLASLTRPLAQEIAGDSLTYEVNFDTPDLKTADPLLSLRRFLEGELDERNASLATTVLSELFLNSVDHGVLRLDSRLKDDPDGFFRFFEMREAALSRLVDGTVRVRLNISRFGRRRILNVQVEDSGFGFAPRRVMEEKDEMSLARHGRGLTLVKAFCSRLAWSNGGRTVEADMLLDTPQAGDLVHRFESGPDR